MKERKYLFRREDNDKVVEVDWATMMTASGGFLTLPDGTVARRCVHLEVERYGDTLSLSAPRRRPHRVIVSDNLGFGEHQLAAMEADRKMNGFKGIEFTRDPMVPQFFQVKATSRQTMDRYTRHRGYENVTGKGS